MAVAAPYGHTAVDPAAGAIHGHQPATLTAPRGGWGRRLLRQSVNPFGIAWAAVLGAAGAAVVEFTRHAPAPAAVTAAVTFLVVYGVRMVLAASGTPPR